MSTSTELITKALNAQNRVTAHAIEHKSAREERDSAILDAHTAGATYPELSLALGLHESRIKQILSAQRKLRR